MKERKRIIIEFINDDEVAVYDKLRKISYPAALIKDLLCKKIKFEVLEAILNEKN